MFGIGHNSCFGFAVCYCCCFDVLVLPILDSCFCCVVELFWAV